MKIYQRVAMAGLLSACIVTNAVADEAKSSGTAFVVTRDGWLMTNAHVVEGCDRILVKGNGFATDPRLDTTNDLALIKITPDKPLTPLPFRRAPIRLGEDIVAIGYPLAGLLADSIKITTGNVNALAGLKNDTRYIQISTPIQPGNSGGPVTDEDGLLIGITSATLAKQVSDQIGVAAQNVNFAIRSSVADIFMQSQSVVGQDADRDAEKAAMSTADLADKITPSVHQVLCYGRAEVQASAHSTETPASLPRVTMADHLIDARGYDAIGFDYETLKDTSFQGCKSACDDDGQCKAVTYNTKHQVCFLKNNVVALIRNSDAMAAYSSSKASEVIVSDFTSYSGVDLPGGDYKRINHTNYLECFVSCIGDRSCKAFSYISKKKECWLKDALSRPNTAKGVELGIK